MKNVDVSIIVPLYYGRKYIDNIINQVTKCYKKLRNYSIELILYNDSPDEEINLNGVVSDYKIKVIQTTCNKGIHVARTEGLKHSKGSYILFLDQDDVIYEDYLYSQIDKIGEKDAIVCRLLNNNKQHYNNTFVFEEVISKEFMTNCWCSIVSPGQVLIKRDAIPEIWLNNCLNNNGADDYFLWILMFMQDREFALNQDILFEHINTGSNTSYNTNKMMDSEQEMLELLVSNNILSNLQVKRLSESLRRIHVADLDKKKRLCDFFIRWNQNIINKKIPYKRLIDNNINRIAIYGASELGQSIDMLLEDTPIRMNYYIDQNAKYLTLSKPVFELNKKLEKVDAVILTIADNNVRKNIYEIMNCKVYLAEELLG